MRKSSLEGGEITRQPGSPAGSAGESRVHRGKKRGKTPQSLGRAQTSSRVRGGRDIFPKCPKPCCCTKHQMSRMGGKVALGRGPGLLPAQLV